MELSLSRRQQEAWLALNDPLSREVFAGGGAGGGKTWLGCLRQIYRRIAYPGTRGFIGRETFTALRDSTMKTYFDLCGKMGYKEGIHYTYNAGEHVCYWQTDPVSEQHFRYMAYSPGDPNYDRFGSTEYTDAFVDEAPEVSARACQILLSRIRYKHREYSLKPEILYTGNPGSTWVKEKFVMDAFGNFIDLPDTHRRVLFTVKDNPDETIRTQYAQTLAMLDDYDRARLLEGRWDAVPKAARPFAFAFEEARHRRVCERRPGDTVFFSVDFNVDPFSAIAAHIWQDGSGHHVHVFAEAKLKEASVDAMADWMRTVCPDITRMRITGDRGGNSRIIGRASTFSLFDELRKVLRISPAQFTVPPNPTHAQSRTDTNTVLTLHHDMRVDPLCSVLLADLRRVEVDANGHIIKKDRSRLDQRADSLDCLRYLLNTYLKEWIKRAR